MYKICQNEECGTIQELGSTNKLCHVWKTGILIDFAIYGIKEQIKIILKNQSYLNQIKKSNDHRKNKSERFPLESALDGDIHLKLPIDKENETTISININSDGAPLIKSRKFAMWPVLGTIVELNQSSRESFRNVILLGLWIHRKKPKLNKFFCKSYEELVELKNKPLNIGKFNKNLYYIKVINPVILKC